MTQLNSTSGLLTAVTGMRHTEEGVHAIRPREVVEDVANAVRVQASSLISISKDLALISASCRSFSTALKV